MKILSLSTDDTGGGAHRAAFRLHRALREKGIDSSMLVHTKSSSDPAVVPAYLGAGAWQRAVMRYRGRIDPLPLIVYPNRAASPWSVNWMPNGIARQVERLRPDIIHLNWTGSGFLPIRALAGWTSPIVWTLHDSWAFTGGCHIPGDCTAFRERCGRCPQLGSGRERDLSRWIWNQKHRYWRDTNLTIVTPSRWLADRARSSALLADRRIEVIPNGVDITVFQPGDRLLARRLLNLPGDKALVLFAANTGTSDRNKGFHLLRPALQQLARTRPGAIELVLLGDSTSLATRDQPGSATHDQFGVGMKVHALGYVHDEETLTRVYSAADVLVAPSLEENLPNTILEALACGTPAVAFQIGGIPELIDHEGNGYLVRPYDVEALAGGLAWVIDDETRRRRLGEAARRTIEEGFDVRRIAERYLQVYETVLR